MIMHLVYGKFDSRVPKSCTI